MIRGKGALSLNSIADVWKNGLDRLRSQLSETTINTWFDEVEVVTLREGDFFNVMGLPVLRLSRMLAQFGIKLL